MVILTVQTVKGAGMVKNRQITMSEFRSFGNRILRISAAGAGRADKIAHTVGGQRVKVKVQITFMGPAADDTPVFHAPLTAEPCLTFGYGAVMNAQTTKNAVIFTRRLQRKAVCPAAVVVNFFNLGPDRIKVGPDTIGAEANSVGNGPAAFLTKITCSHVAGFELRVACLGLRVSSLSARFPLRYNWFWVLDKAKSLLLFFISNH